DGVKAAPVPENRIIYFGYKFGDAPLKSSNVTDKNPFDDPKVREAMELAVDREAIKRVVMRGQSVPAGVAMPPFVNGWTPDLDAFPAPDIAKAKELLAEARSEEHTSELQSRENLVCRLLLEKKKIER